ncbi:MAG: ATP-binding protein [Variovorax sp.]
MPAPTFQGSGALTLPGPLDSGSARPRRGWRRISVSLFWRTFCFLALLLTGSTVLWLQTFRALEYEPRAIQTAHQIASLVNLTRAGLLYSDAITRVSLIKTLADQEGVRIVPHDRADLFEPYRAGPLDSRITDDLTQRLGHGALLAGRVNGEPGFWIGFTIGAESWWLLLDPARFNRLDAQTWAVWLATAVVLSLAGAALITRFVNLPLQQLSSAAERVRDGEYEAHRLDEDVHTSEIRAVNVGFNRMADQLAKIEQDRAVMLAGISHDLRTPLARLRLETEMSVVDAQARDHMAADIAQLDLIIDKFLDYARPDSIELRPVSLRHVADACANAVRNDEEIRVTVNVPADMTILADEVELSRVISNLLENARRYGKTPGTGTADVTISARLDPDAVWLKVRDHGPGVAEQLLPLLTKPFFRGDAARTSAVGAGLGLSIVAKNIERMRGRFALASSAGRGLAAHIRMPRYFSQATADGGARGDMGRGP